jgi:hypothetical protein
LSNGGGASGGATSFAGGSTVWPIYPANSIKSNNNIYKLTSKSQYSDFITSLFININIELIIIIITKHKHQWHYRMTQYMCKLMLNIYTLQIILIQDQVTKFTVYGFIQQLPSIIASTDEIFRSILSKHFISETFSTETA